MRINELPPPQLRITNATITEPVTVSPELSPLCDTAECAYDYPPATHIGQAPCCTRYLCTGCANYFTAIAPTMEPSQITCGVCGSLFWQTEVQVKPL